MIDKDKVLIISNHYRRILLFEDTMHHLWDSGYKNIWIQNTGDTRVFGQYAGKYSEYWNVGFTSYDIGMSLFKRREVPPEIEIICLIDNDCFLENSSVLDKYIDAFTRDEFDWAAHHISRKEYTSEYDFSSSSICLCPRQEFVPSDVGTYAPKPHWENAFLLIRRKLWDKQTPDQLSNSRKWIKSTYDLGGKMGAHKAKYKMGWTHYGDGWFHFGNLFSYHLYLERGESNRFLTESVRDAARLGFFLKELQIYGDRCNYTKQWLRRQLGIDKSKEQHALEAWSELVKDTWLQEWK